MNANAVSRVSASTRPGLVSALLAAIGLLLLGAGAAAAAPPGKGGVIHACYVAKGKHKGAMRVVRGRHCRRGERKLAWNVIGPQGAAGRNGAAGATGAAGASGPAGAAGEAGANGQDGLPGAPGSDGAEGTAGAVVHTLETKVETLESVLAGVGEGDLAGVVDKLGDATKSELDAALATVDGITNAQLQGVIGKLNGITDSQLQEAVGALPELTHLGGFETELGDLSAELGLLQGDVGGLDELLDGVQEGDLETVIDSVPGLESTLTIVQGGVSGLTGKVGSLCTQTNKVTDQVNGVGGVLDNLLGGLAAIPLVGDILGGESAPADLPEFNCPT